MARVNVGTSTRSTATAVSNQRKIVKASDGTLILFAVTGTTSETRLQYKVSADDGATWSASWISAYNVANVSDFDIYIDTNDDILLCITISTYTRFVKLVYSAGTWTAGTIYTPNYAGHSKSSITRRANGDIWITAGKASNYIYYYVSTDEGVTWSADTYDTGGTNYINVTQIIKNGADIWVLAINNGVVQCHIYNGSWSTVTIEDLGLTGAGYEAVGIKISDSEIWCAVRTTSGIKIYKYTTSWDAGTLITDSQYDSYPTMSNIGGKAIICWDDWDGSYWQTAYRVYNGISWDAQVTLTSDVVNNRYTSSINSDASTLYLSCTNGGGSPYIVYFDKVVFLTPSTQKTINSNIKFKGTIQKTILSDILFIGQNQKIITSDVYFVVPPTIQKTILSDILFIAEVLYNMNNKVNFVTRVLSDINNKFTYAVRTLSNINNFINTCISVISDINNDFRTKKLVLNNVSNDIRFLYSWQKATDGGLQSLGKTYITVYIGGVLQTDVDIDSINISKGLNSAHTASFDLGRAYDSTKPVMESIVLIKYNNWILYSGYVTQISPAEGPEKIRVNCQNEYWKQNKSNVYYQVGHQPTDDTDLYYNTFAEALTVQHSWTPGIGNFVPETLNNFAIGKSDAISNIIQECGIYGWFYDVDASKKLWVAGQGSIVNLERQTIGANINLNNILNHSFDESVEDIVNKFRVQMGEKIKAKFNSTGGTQIYTRPYNWGCMAVPNWNGAYERLSNKTTGLAEGWNDHTPSQAVNYQDVFKKYKLPTLNPNASAWSDINPPKVKIYDWAGWDLYVGTSKYTYGYLTEGFSIDYENGILTMNEAFYLGRVNGNGELEAIRAPQIHLMLWKQDIYTYTLDPSDDPETDVSNPQMFFTDKMGSYAETVIKDLNLSNLSIQVGGQYGTEFIPSWDDTDFAHDVANWELSKSCDKKIKGNIEITLDALCFYGIDLTKRIYISGITDEVMNITDISYNINNFTVKLTLENSRYYNRTVSLQSHGE